MRLNNSYNPKYSLALRNSEFLRYYAQRSSNSKLNKNSNINSLINLPRITQNNLTFNKTSNVNLTYNLSGKTQNSNPKLLKAENNVLNLGSSSCFKIPSASGGFTSIYYNSSYNNVYTTDTACDPDINKLCRFLSSLMSDSSGFEIYSNYSDSEVKDLMSSVGIEPGYFEVTDGYKTNRFYLGKDGCLNGEYQIESRRIAFNKTNWFDEGYTTNSSIIIHDQEYKLDTDGHLNIPENVAFTMQDVKIIK